MVDPHTQELTAHEREEARKALRAQQASVTASIGHAKDDLPNSVAETAQSPKTLEQQERSISEIRASFVHFEKSQLKIVEDIST